MADDIVTYKGEPALVIGHTKGGGVSILRFRGRMVRAILTKETEPYTGDKDAVALGLKEQHRPLR